MNILISESVLVASLDLLSEFTKNLRNCRELDIYMVSKLNLTMLAIEHSLREGRSHG